MTVMELAGGSPLPPAFCEQADLCLLFIQYVDAHCFSYIPPQIVSHNYLHLQYQLLTLGVSSAHIER